MDDNIPENLNNSRPDRIPTLSDWWNFILDSFPSWDWWCEYFVPDFTDEGFDYDDEGNILGWKVGNVAKLYNFLSAIFFLYIVCDQYYIHFIFQRVYYIPDQYNPEFLFDLVEFYFERLEDIFEVDGVKHIYYPLPVGGMLHKVYFMLPLFIFGNVLVINIIYILSGQATVEMTSAATSERDSVQFRGQEAIITLFHLIDIEPPYKNKAELNAFITLLCAICPIILQDRICAHAHSVFKERWGSSYNILIGTHREELEKYSPSSLHFAYKILEKMENPYYNN